jgi:hypothetical protein
LVNDPYLILDKRLTTTLTISTDETQRRFDFIVHIFERIVRYSSDVDNHHTRQAALLWLLIFLIYCRRPYLHTTYRSLFESNIFILQTNLIYGLVDNDELNQELACKCLIYIYEIIDNDDLRSTFNEKLFEYFIDSTRTFASQQTTVAYEHAQQPSTHFDNTQLILYKELCSLVDLVHIERNQRSQLFYAFLYLVHENAIWSTTRYGQVFCSHDYEKKSIECIHVYIEQFIGRLYRLLYDPHVRVQDAMKRTWNKLFSSNKFINIVDKYFPVIFNEFYRDLHASRWRVRESIQLAFLDIFRMLNRKLIDNHEYVCIFHELFRRLLSVCDDTKESVRKAALTTIHAFKQNCILLACDPATTISNTYV